MELFELKCANAVFKVRGLCGTLTWNQHDDFTTPEGDVETSVSSFAGKFTTEHCTLPKGSPPDPCTTYTQRRQYAETVCSVIHSPVFQVVCIMFVKSPTISEVRIFFYVPLFFSHTCSSISDFVGVSWRCGEGALFPSLSVWGLWLCSTKSLSLHHPHCLHPTMRSRGRSHPLAQSDLLP